ncbi:MAG: hypothetical protein JST16_18860 [Bdellovibrionales bacterium]|nr:hypothetical protein [Bdellovibrionales bacterium]
MKFLTQASLLGLVLLTAGCGRKHNFLYEKIDYPPPPVTPTSAKKDIFQIEVSPDFKPVDILWIIDNSGSMESHQQMVIQNTDRFMSLFMALGTMDWTMGLISTDISDPPYIGFAGQPLGSSSRNPVADFRWAVSRLGTSGDSTERSFDPAVSALTSYPQFMRPNAFFALIIISDEAEQSEQYHAQKFYDYLKAIKGTNMAAYMVMTTSQPGCSSSETISSDSPGDGGYADFAQLMKAKVYSLKCPTYGDSLIQMSQDIVSKTAPPVVVLDRRPVPTSIHVLYQGKELPAGDPSQGGVWTFNIETNSIEFSSLSFKPKGGTNEIQVLYDAVDSAATFK